MSERGAEFLNYSSCSAAAQLLSIPSQQPDPPKHSTPKKGAEDVGRPVFDQSSIYIDFEGNKSSTVLSSVSNMMDKAAVIISEKEQVSNFLANELQKRRTKDDASVVIASKEQQQSLDELNKRIVRGDDGPSSSCRDTATTAEMVAAYGKLLKLDGPRISRPMSSASDTDLASTSRSKLAFERGKDKLNFYCVPVGDSLVLRLKVWNVDAIQMRLKCEITDERGAEHSNFKIYEITAKIMEPGGQCEIAVQYKPTKVERNIAHLVLERTNGEYFKKTFQLIGDGGCADVGLTASNYEDGIAKKTASSQAIVIRPDDPNHFWLEFENRGQRLGFVKLVATNRFGKAIAGDQISIRPDQFVLNAFDNCGDDKKQQQNCWKVSVRVCESFDWCGDASPPPRQLLLLDNIVTTGGHHHQQQHHHQTKEMVVANGNTGGKRRSQQQRREESVGTAATTAGGTATTRDSMLSSSSSSGGAVTAVSASQKQQQPAAECAFRIEVYWGEEQQRQRLKCWYWKRKQLAMANGHAFLNTFEGEQSLSIVQREKIAATLTDGEAAEFKNSLRQLTLNVINVRAKAYFAQLQEESKPLIELYRNQSRLLKETIPNEDSSCSINCVGDSETMGGGGVLLGL